MELWTVEETAAFLKVTLSRRKSQVRQAQPLPAIRLHKKCLRFDKQAIEQWVTLCAQQGRTN